MPLGARDTGAILIDAKSRDDIARPLRGQFTPSGSARPRSPSSAACAWRSARINSVIILNHRVMQKETDDQVAVPRVEDLTARHDNADQREPRQRRSQSRQSISPGRAHRLPGAAEDGQAREREHDPRFQRLRHSAVESAINRAGGPRPGPLPGSRPRWLQPKSGSWTALEVRRGECPERHEEAQ